MAYIYFHPGVYFFRFFLPLNGPYRSCLVKIICNTEKSVRMKNKSDFYIILWVWHIHFALKRDNRYYITKHVTMTTLRLNRWFEREVARNIIYASRSCSKDFVPGYVNICSHIKFAFLKIISTRFSFVQLYILIYLKYTCIIWYVRMKSLFYK